MSGLTASEKVSIYLNLIPYLINHGATPLQELTEQFQVSEATMLRMVHFIPTTGSPGESGAYLPQDLYDIDWELLEEAGIVQLTQVVAVDAPLRFTATQQAALLSGLETLKPTLTAAERTTAQTAALKLSEATSDGVTVIELEQSEEPSVNTLQLLTRAAQENTDISFLYRDRSGSTSQRTVTPHRVLQQRGNWYLEGWCHSRKAPRLFLVQFIEQVTFISQAHEHTHAREVEQALQLNTQAHQDQTIDVEIEVAAHATHLLEPWSPRYTTNQHGEFLRAEVTLYDFSRVIALVTTAPGDIEVLAPAHARAAVLDWALQSRVE